jgi:predicted O-methyltransferase YrrM
MARDAPASLLQRSTPSPPPHPEGERRAAPSPGQFDELVREVVGIAQTIGGYLKRREVKFLALLGACPTAAGDILEIGTFKGKSTVVLAKAALAAGGGRVVAVDPFVLAGAGGPAAALADLRDTLQLHGVADHVEFHQTYAATLARNWNRPIRLLWIDGNHTYAAAKSDFDLFLPFLADGAIVALHDVLNVAEGPLRVFMEDVLLSRHFGVAGLCGSIGWAQYCSEVQAALPCRTDKTALYRRLSRLVPYVAFDQKVRGFRKQGYKFQRWRVPHAEVDPSRWLALVRRGDVPFCSPQR